MRLPFGRSTGVLGLARLLVALVVAACMLGAFAEVGGATSTVGSGSPRETVAISSTDCSPLTTTTTTTTNGSTRFEFTESGIDTVTSTTTTTTTSTDTTTSTFTRGTTTVTYTQSTVTIDVTTGTSTRTKPRTTTTLTSIGQCSATVKSTYTVAHCPTTTVAASTIPGSRSVAARPRKLVARPHLVTTTTTTNYASTSTYTGGTTTVTTVETATETETSATIITETQTTTSSGTEYTITTNSQTVTQTSPSTTVTEFRPTTTKTLGRPTTLTRSTTTYSCVATGAALPVNTTVGLPKAGETHGSPVDWRWLVLLSIAGMAVLGVLSSVGPAGPEA